MIDTQPKITTADELRRVANEARAADGKQDGYFVLAGRVRLNDHVDEEQCVPEAYTPADLTGIDLSGFALSGDFRGANLSGANLSNTLIAYAIFSPISVLEHCPRPDIYGGGPIPGISPRSEFVTNLTRTNLTNARIQHSFFESVSAVGLIAPGATFDFCNLERADFSDSDLRGTVFGPGSDLRQLNTHRAKRLTADHPMQIRQGVDALHNIALTGGVISLLEITLGAQRVSEHRTHIAIAIALVSYFIFICLSLFNIVWRKRSLPELNMPLMLLLILETCLGFFHHLCDPGYTLSPGAYVLALWLFSFLLFLLIRYLRYGDFFRQAIFSRYFFRVLPWRAEADTVTLTLFPAAYTVLWFYLHHRDAILRFYHWIVSLISRVFN